MSLELKKEDIVSVKPQILGNSGSPGDIITGLNGLLKNIDTTIHSATKLLGGYETLKQKLPGQKPQMTRNAPIAYRAPPQQQHEYVEPAVKPVPPPQETIPNQPLPEFSQESKKEKAEALFKELHEYIKPYLGQANFVTAGFVIQKALQPENKEKIIQFIESKL